MERQSSSDRLKSRIAVLAPGLLTVAVGAAGAYAVSTFTGVIGALTVALIAGIVTRNLRLLSPLMQPGLAFATKKLLRAGVVLLGLQISATQVLDLGVATVIVIIVTVMVTFWGTRSLGSRLGFSQSGSMLFATGFSICGAAAVAAMSSVVDADEDEVATSIAMVTLYGTVSIAVFPLMQSMLGLDDREMGVWIGASIHEVAQVVAAASIVGSVALVAAVVTKLARVVLLAPLVTLASVNRRRQHRTSAADRPPVLPLFVIGFLAMAAVSSTGMVPESVLDIGKTCTTVVFAAAMFALGSGVHVPQLIRSGGRAALLGAGSTLLAAGTSYAGILLIR